MPDRMPDRMPEDMSEYMPEDMPDRMPDRMSEDMSDRMPDRMSERMPEDMPDKVPECLPDRTPEDLPDRMPEDMPDRVPGDMPEHMPEDMPGRMPEDIPDRMLWVETPLTGLLGTQISTQGWPLLWLICKWWSSSIIIVLNLTLYQKVGWPQNQWKHTCSNLSFTTSCLNLDWFVAVWNLILHCWSFNVKFAGPSLTKHLTQPNVP